jgi:hypothetical protein
MEDIHAKQEIHCAPDVASQVFVIFIKKTKKIEIINSKHHLNQYLLFLKSIWKIPFRWIIRRDI